MPRPRDPTPQGVDMNGNLLHYSHTTNDGVKYFVQGQNHHHGGHVVAGIPIIAHVPKNKHHHGHRGHGHHHGHAVVGGHGGPVLVGGHGGPVLVGGHGGPILVGGHGGPVLVGGHGGHALVMINGTLYKMG